MFRLEKLIMIKESKMEQKSGRESTNIQIKEFNAGLSYKKRIVS